MDDDEKKARAELASVMFWHGMIAAVPALCLIVIVVVWFVKRVVLSG